jgi:hypothetical protein
MSLRIIILTFCIAVTAFGQWQRVTALPAQDCSSIALVNDTLYAGTDSSVYVSTDGGIVWNAMSPVSGGQEYIEAIAVFNDRIFAGTFLHGVYTSSNNGASWQQINTGLSDLGATSTSDFVIHSGKLILGTQGAGTFVLNPDTQSWSAFGELPINISGTVYGMTSRGDTAIIGAGANGYISRLFPDSTVWIEQSFTGGHLQPAYAFAWLGGDLFASGNHGAFRSSDNGSNWAFAGTGLPGAIQTWICAQGNDLYAWINDFDGSHFYKSTDRGGMWNLVEDEPGAFAYQLLTYGERIYAARGDGLWYWTVTATHVEESANPRSFALNQNYPNPFNPETEIRYEVADVRGQLSRLVGWEVSRVKLAVYDLLGREVAVLVNETLPAGVHKATWNASGFPSGVYFYRLESGPSTVRPSASSGAHGSGQGLVETRKMVLVR